MTLETSAGRLRNEKDRSGQRQRVTLREIQPIPNQEFSNNTIRDDVRARDETINPNRSYRFNNNIDWSRASFKVKKTKPGKVKYLSKTEIWSLGLSFLLSLIIAGFLVAVTVYLTPIVAKNFSNFIEDVGILSNAMTGKLNANQRKDVWSSIPQRSWQLENRDEFLKTINRHKTPVIFSALPSSVVDSCSFCRAGVEDPTQTCKELNQTEIINSVFNNSSFLTTFTGDMKIFSQSYPHSSLLEVIQSRFIYQVCGLQQWIIFRHDQIPTGGFDPSKPIAELLEVYSNNFKESRHVWHGDLHVNEALFIPEGWYAASSTILGSSDDENSTYITLTTPAAEQSGFMYYWSIGQQRLISGDYAGAIKMFKLGLGISRNLMLLDSMADALNANQQFLASEEFYRESIAINPRNPLTYSKLINLMINHATKDVSTSITELLDQAGAIGLHEKVLELSHNEL